MLALALQQAQPMGQLGSFVPLIVMAVLAWLLLFRPAQQQRKETEAMRAGLATGDEVLTTGGLYGTVTRLRDDRIHLRIADGVQVEVARSAVSSVVSNRERE